MIDLGDEITAEGGTGKTLGIRRQRRELGRTMAWLMQDAVKEDEERAQRERERREAEKRRREEEVRAAADHELRQLKERRNKRLASQW